MALDYQLIHFPLRGGLDTKTHPHALAAPKLRICTNVVFDELGALSKRSGSTTLGLTTVAGGSITAARMRALGVLGDELLLFAEGKCYSWSAKESAWIDRGRFESLLADYKTVLFDRTDQVTPDRATTGNVTVIAWEDRTNSAARWACIDNVTGAVMQSSSTPVLSGGQRPKCLALNGKLLVFMYDSTGSAIKCDVIDPADVYGTLGASLQTIATDEVGPFDVTPYSSTECAIAYIATGPVATVKRVDSTGTVTATGATARICQTAIAIDYHSGVDKFALVRLDDTAGAAGGDVFLDWLKADLTDDGANVNIAVVANEAGGNVHNLAVSVLTGQTAYVFWDKSQTTLNSLAVNGRRHAIVFRALCSSSAVTSERVLARKSCIGSRALRWSDGSAERVVIHVYCSSDLQSQYVLLDADYVVGDRNDTNANRGEVGILARLFPGEGPSTTSTRTVEPAAVLGGLARTGHLPQIESLGSNQYACALTFQRSEESTTTNYKKVYHERGIRDVTYTAFDSRAFTGKQEGEALYGPGGYLWMYDGRRVQESGFFLYPEMGAYTADGTFIVVSNSTGSLTENSTYYYRVYYEWLNARGERERSTYSGNFTVVTNAGEDTVHFEFLPTLQYTSKFRGATTADGSNVRIVIYRSPAGDPSRFYRVSSFDPGASNIAPENNPNVEYVEFEDGMSDTDLVNQEQDYISAGELDNTPALASPFFAAGQARGFTRHPEDKYLILYSKKRMEGDVLAFHSEHQIRVPQAGGEVKGVVVTEGALYILSERTIYICVGQGPSNTGGPPEYADPQPIVQGVGCTEPRSIISTATGIFFKSKKGIYRLPYGGGVEYVGAGVEDYNTGYDIVGAIDIPDKHRVEFTTSTDVSGSVVLVYDYLVNEWSTFESVATWGVGRHSVLWGDTPVRLDAVGVWKPQTTYADISAGYNLQAAMRIRPADLIGWSRTRHVYVLGEWKSSHDLRIVLSYDDTTTTGTFDYSATETAAASPYRFSASPADGRQQASAIDVAVFDRTPTGGGTWREGMKLTGIALSVGFKKGGPRLPPGQIK